MRQPVTTPVAGWRWMCGCGCTQTPPPRPVALLSRISANWRAALGLARAWRADPHAPSWARRYSVTTWARVLAGPACHGWTSRDVNQLIRDWIGVGHWLPAAPHKPIGLLRAILAWHANLAERPAALEQAREAAERAARTWPHRRARAPSMCAHVRWVGTRWAVPGMPRRVRWPPRQPARSRPVAVMAVAVESMQCAAQQLVVAEVSRRARAQVGDVGFGGPPALPGCCWRWPTQPTSYDSSSIGRCLRNALGAVVAGATRLPTPTRPGGSGGSAWTVESTSSAR